MLANFSEISIYTDAAAGNLTVQCMLSHDYYYYYCSFIYFSASLFPTQTSRLLRASRGAFLTFMGHSGGFGFNCGTLMVLFMALKHTNTHINTQNTCSASNGRQTCTN